MLAGLLAAVEAGRLGVVVEEGILLEVHLEFHLEVLLEVGIHGSLEDHPGLEGLVYQEGLGVPVVAVAAVAQLAIEFAVVDTAAVFLPVVDKEYRHEAVAVGHTVHRSLVDPAVEVVHRSLVDPAVEVVHRNLVDPVVWVVLRSLVDPAVGVFQSWSTAVGLQENKEFRCFQREN